MRTIVRGCNWSPVGADTYPQSWHRERSPQPSVAHGDDATDWIQARFRTTPDRDAGHPHRYRPEAMSVLFGCDGFPSALHRHREINEAVPGEPEAWQEQQAQLPAPEGGEARQRN